MTLEATTPIYLANEGVAPPTATSLGDLIPSQPHLHQPCPYLTPPLTGPTTKKPPKHFIFLTTHESTNEIISTNDI